MKSNQQCTKWAFLFDVLDIYVSVITKDIKTVVMHLNRFILIMCPLSYKYINNTTVQKHMFKIKSAIFRYRNIL